MSKRTLDESTDDEEPVHDIQRTRQETSADDKVITCTLPPRCNLKPRKFNVAAYETHYQRDHVNVCYECDASLPSAHFLDLHLNEVHSPIFEARKERGEAVFRCFVESCPNVFSTITRRRRHLEYDHAYPAEYRFNVVQKGLNSYSQSLLYPAKTLSQPESVEPKPKPEVPELNRAARRALARGGQKDTKMKDPKPVVEDAKSEHARAVEALFKQFDQL